jgi:hypothetical protein
MPGAQETPPSALPATRPPASNVTMEEIQMSTTFVVGAGFEGKNLEAQKAARKHAAAMVTNISAETREAVRYTILRSIRDGIASRDAAKLIRAMVGMTERAAVATLNFRESLLELGLAPDSVEAKVDRFIAKKIRERALTIARTEVISALNAGQIANWRSAQASGLLGANAMMEWMVTTDGACSVCQGMDGERVKVGGNFSQEGPPAHPHCRCTIGLIP